jgi:acetyltransferase-like isoleucine patch superfamily enzyme
MNEPILSHDWYPRPLPPNVVLGEGSWLYSAFSFLHFRSKRPCGLRVGRRSGLYSGTFFNLGPEGEVEIGSDCTLVGVILSTNRRVVIEDYSLLAHEVVIADSFADVPPGRSGQETGRPEDPAPPIGVIIRENVWIGARAVLLSGARIGAGAIIGAAAVVDFEVPPYAIVAGNPAKIVGWARPREKDPS